VGCVSTAGGGRGHARGGAPAADGAEPAHAAAAVPTTAGDVPCLSLVGSGSHGRWKRPLPSNSPHDHMILRVDLVGSHGRWTGPCLQTALDATVVPFQLLHQCLTRPAPAVGSGGPVRQLRLRPRGGQLVGAHRRDAGGPAGAHAGAAPPVNCKDTFEIPVEFKGPF
jgi:hypothetical protein